MLTPHPPIQPGDTYERLGVGERVVVRRVTQCTVVFASPHHPRRMMSLILFNTKFRPVPPPPVPDWSRIHRALVAAYMDGYGDSARSGSLTYRNEAASLCANKRVVEMRVEALAVKTPEVSGE